MLRAYDHELIHMYKEMLDDCNQEMVVAGITISPSEALQSCDRIAFKCGFNDYIASLISDKVITVGDPQSSSDYYWTEAN